jgi:hypothetical protein
MPPSESPTTDFRRFEQLVREKLGTEASCKISTVQIANALQVSVEEAAAVCEQYNQSSDRRFEFSEERRAPDNPHHRRLAVRRASR